MKRETIQSPGSPAAFRRLLPFSLSPLPFPLCPFPSALFPLASPSSPEPAARSPPGSDRRSASVIFLQPPEPLKLAVALALLVLINGDFLKGLAGTDVVVLTAVFRLSEDRSKVVGTGEPV
jgi:hypothetical protein